MSYNFNVKSALTSFSVSLDLTKCRYSLLAKTKSIIKDNPAVMFAFADINCSLALKLDENKFRKPKMNLIRFYKNVSQCSVIMFTNHFCKYVSLT